ncbi:putative membrane protein, partial [Escherichia coli 8.0586]
RLSDNPAATPSVINFLVTFGGISFTPWLLCRPF